MLLATGCAGRPLEHFETLLHSSLPRQPREYFSDPEAPPVLDLLPPLEEGVPSAVPPQEWWARVLAEGSTDNGVWGGKVMWGHLPDFVARARALPGLQSADLATLLAMLLGEPTFIFVTRQDKVGQAVSLWKALQTQSWRADDESADHEPTYDFAAIDYLAGQLEADERAWTRWFVRSGRHPTQVRYERLDESPRQVVGEVLEVLGLADAAVPDPPLKRQRDELSLEWIDRYLRDRAGAPAV